jgi:hypothetical protein
MDTKKTYVCLGTCQAVISEEQYNEGLTKCGAKGCSLEGHTFVPGKKNEVTGKNEATSDAE